MTNKTRNLLWLCWFYSFTVFVYVIGMQMLNPGSVYWPVAVWLPIRMDFFGEAGFILSIIFAAAAILTNNNENARK
jgi:hypothetical protein